jgi:hypothetical protein
MKMLVEMGVGGMFPLKDILPVLLLHIMVNQPGGILLGVRVDYNYLTKLMRPRARRLDLGLGLEERRRGRREVLGRPRKRRRKGRKREELVMPVYVSFMLFSESLCVTKDETG